jgi:phosphoglycolate phosphatase
MLRAVSTRAILFDLDGTLVDSLADIADTVDAVLARAGLPVHGRAAYRDMVGDGLAVLVERASRGHPATAALIAAARERYWATCTATTRPFPGIEDATAELARRGFALAVLTNKPEPLAQRVVEACFTPGRFRCVLGERAGRPRKPDPAGALEIARALDVESPTCLVVGDMPIDVLTARAAGMRAAAVTWGYGAATALAAASPDHVLATPAELLDLVAAAC